MISGFGAPIIASDGIIGLKPFTGTSAILTGPLVSSNPSLLGTSVFFSDSLSFHIEISSNSEYSEEDESTVLETS